MPVTAKVSEQFYKTFGHKQVDELVNWCNQVDETYRTEFRDLFTANFARFDAKLEQRSTEMKADGYTHAFLVTFADEKGREVYLPHPAHKEFGKLVGPHIDKVFVFDYWTK